MLTQHFVSRYENDEFEETMDFVEWIGESRLLKCLREKAGAIRDIQFTN